MEKGKLGGMLAYEIGGMQANSWKIYPMPGLTER